MNKRTLETLLGIVLIVGSIAAAIIVIFHDGSTAATTAGAKEALMAITGH